MPKGLTILTCENKMAKPFVISLVPKNGLILHQSDN